MRDFVIRNKRKLFVLFLFIVIFILMVYSLYFTDLFVVKEVKVSGGTKISRDDVIRLTGLKGGERLFRIDLKELKKRIESHPYVEEAFLARRPPSVLEIVIKEREGLAILVLNNKGYLVDRKGVILGSILPQDYLFYPLIEIKDDTWKDNFFKFLSWLKDNKRYLPVYENYSKITLERDKIILQTKTQLKIYFPLGVVEDMARLYQNLDKIMVYLYETNMIEKVELIRLDYPQGKALIKFRG